MTDTFRGSFGCFRTNKSQAAHTAIGQTRPKAAQSALGQTFPEAAQKDTTVGQTRPK